MATPPADIIAAACEAQRKWKIPASISLAQWALESGWGRHMPPGSNNPFGMKARAGDPFVTVRTREQDRDGHDYFIEAAFRKFGSIAEAFDAHGGLLNKPVYARARAARALFRGARRNRGGGRCRRGRRRAAAAAVSCGYEDIRFPS